jgi:hypothetical protein
MLKKFSAVLTATLIGVTSLFAQDAQLRNIPSGQKVEVKGVIVLRSMTAR